MKKLSKITESIWSDIQDRSSGDTVRKEDSVNLMDKVEFFDYIQSHYNVIIDCEAPGYGSAYIRYPLFFYRTVRYVLFSTYSHRIMVRTPYIEVWPDNLLDIIKTKYKREDTIDKNRDRMTYISPKEGEGNNEFFLDFIDTILANVDKPAIEKKSLNESIWSDIQDRSAGDIRRKEDGVKVHTCIDVDIYLKNASDSYYEELIKEILNYNDSHVDYRVGILNIRDKAYSTEEMKNIRAFEAPYAYLIYDGGHGTDLIAEFWTYDEMKDFDLDDFEDRVPEEDYISICKGIATKLKEVGRDIEYLPRNKGYFIGYEKKNRFKDFSNYEGDYVLQLIDESDVYNWEIEYVDKYGEGSTSTSLEDFRESIIDTFPELDDVDFITWSFNNYACNIGIPITAGAVKNFKKYKEYTKNWFTVDEEAE